ncbi:RNA polymerase sigma factor [Arenibacter sp. ARW7G5Y1]|uniref:RNA polymerase sigma factor n=1 Tax=Arenibacter sp. ARW7G5Y1 TaxID=2135619 RepID=UPI000D963D2F|nr:RNA polymerase sigma-70 factor (ECF subfamily) [Arenibacter sp. ARW7G5Y1]
MYKNNLQIEIIFKKHYKDLCLIAYNYLQDVSDAEDIVQEVFISILRNKKIGNIANVKSYLWQCVKNACINKLKREKKLYCLNEAYTLDYNYISKEEEMICLENQLYLYQQIDLLPKQCKKIFLKCAINGDGYKQVSEDLEISVNAVKNQIKRAYKFLRESLTDYYIFIGAVQLSIFLLY